MNKYLLGVNPFLSFLKSHTYISSGILVSLLLFPLLTLSTGQLLNQKGNQALEVPIGNTGMSVLAAETENNAVQFTVNVPSVFAESAAFEKGLTIKDDLTVTGKLILSEGSELEADQIDLGDGSIIAGNIIYSIEAGSGLSITEGQSPTITNTGVLSLGGKTGAVSLSEGTGIDIDGVTVTNSDPGSSQKIFKTIVIGADSFSAGSNTDSLEFAAGTGITLTADTTNKKLTIASSGGGAAGVTTLDGLDGGLTISNTTGSGTTITIDDATTAAKGIASFNSTNFSVTSGAVNLVQNIHTGASPTFVGLTLSGLSTNGGLLYTNGSGVLSQMSAGTSGYVLTSNGAGNAPSWQTMTSSQWTTNGLKLYYSTGNVGVGTTSPTQPLEVYGNIQSSDGTFVAQIKGDSGGPRITFGDTGDPASLFGIGAYNSVNNIDTKSRNLRIFSTSDTVGLTYLAATGNVGIGTTTPIGLLNVVGGPIGKALILLNQTGDQDILAASTSGTTKLRINNSGQLYMADGSAPSSTTNMLYPVSGTLYWNGSAISGLTSSQWTTSSSNIYYNSGNVGIGTTSVTNKLTINGLTTADSNAVFALGTGGISNKGLVIQGYSGQGSNLQEWQSSTGVLLAGIDANGLFKAYDTSIVPSYGNSGGTGNRTASITVTGVQCCYNNSLSEAVDGTTTAQSGFGFWEYNGGSAFNVVNDSITFDFGSTKLVKEVTLYMYGPASTSQGTWKWQGSNNGSSFTDIGGNFSITTTGSVSQIVITTLSGNATSYRYYRMQGVSGQFNGGVSNNGQNHSFDEFNFKIASIANSVNTTIAYNYIDMGGSVAGTHALTISTAKVGKALVLFNETGDQDILAASSSGTTKFRINNSGQLYMADGSAPSSTTNMIYAVSGSLYWNGSVISGLTSSQWTTSGSNIYYNTGNIGIGTSSPLGLLNVEGGPIGKSLLILNQTGNQAILSASVSGATKFIVDNSGNVGIGTTSPNTLLDLRDTRGGNASLIIDQQGTNSPDIFTASSSGTTRFTIANNGNIGINTTSTANPITVGTDNTNGNGANLSAGGSWNNGSSLDFKENIESLNYDEILLKINRLAISEWNYKNESDTIKHIGPIAEDFYDIFGVGNDKKHISTIDPAGIALAGIKALSKQVNELKSQLLTASISAHFIPSETLSESLDWNMATASGDLTVLGRTTLTDVGITGKIVSGLLSIDGGEGEINVLGDLKLQANGFGKVDLFAGKVTVDNNGNIKTEGSITAKKLNIDTTDVAGASAGEGVVKEGTNSINIETTSVTTDSLIQVTFSGDYSPATRYWIAEKNAGDSFSVKLDKNVSADTSFTWWIVN